MKKYLPQLVCIVLLTVVIMGVFGHLANGQVTPAITAPVTAAVPSAIGSIAKLFNLDFQGFFNELIASVMSTLLTAMGFVLAISGALLNFSINLTLHIRDFVNGSPAIYSTWKAIRDISGLFIIFALLYAAIKMILGFDAKFGELIKNIVIAGVLINFSFFFAGLGVDASNIVSVQLYNAIAPSNSLSAAAATQPIIGPAGISFSKMDGGLSDIFMNNLKVQKVYEQSLAPNGSGPLTPIKIFLAGVIGIMIELAATISFLAATLAFIVRFVMLLLLLAFSPVWFAAHVVPMTQEYSKKWTETYKGMLIFMPVYLLLMYLALNVLTSSPLLTGTAAAPTDPWYAGFLSLGVNAVIVIFLLNMPLVAAVSVAGTTLKFIDTKKLGAGAMWKKLGSQAGSRIPGRMAYSLNNSNLMKSVASTSPIVGQLASSGLSKVSTAGFGGGKAGGYEARLKEKSKNEEAMHKKLGTVDESKYNVNPRNYDLTTQGGRNKLEKEKAALAKAKDQAKSFQRDYRESLPWTNMFTGKPGGVIGFMVDNRANRQTSAKLSKETEKKELLGQEKSIRKQKKDVEDELSALEAEIKRQGNAVGFMPGKPPSAEQLKKKEELEKKIAEHDKTLDDIEETKDEARIDKIAGGVAQKNKEEGGGGGGGGEKKEDKAPKA